jgi:hypothetical protein
MNAISHTHKHTLARQCLPREVWERRACDTPNTQGAWLFTPPLLSMDMRRGNAYKPITGVECMLNHILNQKHHSLQRSSGKDTGLKNRVKIKTSFESMFERSPQVQHKAAIMHDISFETVVSC